MAYADYVFYQAVYGGALDEETFNAAIQNASAYIDAVTWGRLRRGWPVTDDVRMACCAVVDAVSRSQAYTGAISGRPLGLASFTNDGYSESYAGGDAALAQAESERKAAVDLYIPPGHPLRYAGGDPPCSVVTKP